MQTGSGKVRLPARAGTYAVGPTRCDQTLKIDLKSWLSPKNLKFSAFTRIALNCVKMNEIWRKLILVTLVIKKYEISHL